MAKTNASTPARPPPLKKQASSEVSNKNQRSILGFFSKTSAAKTNGAVAGNGNVNMNGAKEKEELPVKNPAFNKVAVNDVTPVPSSDAVGPASSQENIDPAEVNSPSRKVSALSMLFC